MLNLSFKHAFYWSLVLTLMFAPGGAHAKNFHVLYSFCAKDNCADGAYPATSLIRDSTGNLYGTTGYGGKCNAGCGTVFKLAPNGTESVLYDFTGPPDGQYPSGLIMDNGGNLYGTTQLGGANGDGTVFKVAPDGTETILHSFTGGSDGDSPIASLIADAQGNLYGTTLGGGGDGCAGIGCGTVFKIASDGSEAVLYSFCIKTNCSDGSGPYASLIADKAGNLYGTTEYGGASDCFGGCGTAFRLAPNGNEMVLYSFCARANCADGAFPTAPLIADKVGNLYGTTGFGGVYSNGVVFELAPHGVETVLYAFTGGSDGAEPQTGLVADTVGNLYGTTVAGGSKCPLQGGCGTIYQLAPTGMLTALYSTGSAASGLIWDRKGNLYGTLPKGGAHKKGMVFALRE